MDKLRAMALFVRVTELGSFSRVADEAGLAKSVVSKEISRLEQQLGARLLQRSSRKLQLTEVGRGYLLRCCDVLQKVAESEAYVQDAQVAPKGVLRINAPMALGTTLLGQAFAGFMQQYPKISLDMQLTDEAIDLIEHGFDLGFRVASRSFDSHYIGKPLHKFQYRICAAPGYLASHPPLLTPTDLQHHNCFEYSYFRGRNVWPIGNGDGIEIHGNLKANSTRYLLDAVKQGLGVAFIPDFVCQDALDKQQIAEVLTDFHRPELTLYALYPARQFVPPKVSCCIDYLQQWFKNLQ